MREKLINLFLVLTSCIVGFVICELSYRAYADARDKERWLRRNQFSVFSRSIWEFSADFGWDYTRSSHSDVSIIRDGIPRRCRTANTDRFGSPGKGGDPSSSVNPTFVVLGDSFTAMVHDEETWPDIVGSLLRNEAGLNATILNRSRDGYGVLQMFDQAAHLVREGLRPQAFIVAIIGPDLVRPRLWRMTLQRNGREEVFLATVPSLDVHPETHIRAALIDPRATRDWCERLRASVQTDQTAKEIERDVDVLRVADEPVFRRRLNFFALTECYICNRIRYGRPEKAPPLNRYNPAHALMRFQDDPRFVENVNVIRSANVPVWLIYLPFEPELRRGMKNLTSQESSLLDSLKGVVDRFVDITPADPMGDAALPLTMRPEDYHPSRLGLEYYARKIFPYFSEYLRK